MLSPLFSRRHLLKPLLIIAGVVVLSPILGMTQGMDHLKTANTAQIRGDLDLAIVRYTMAIQSGDLSKENRAQAYNNRGIAHERKGDYDRAIQDFDEAIRLNPKYAEAYSNRGNSYSSKGDSDRAIRDFNEAIRINPKLAQAYNNRGIAYSSKGENDRAIHDFDEAIRQNSKYGQAYAGRGYARFYSGLYSAAQGDFKKRLDLEPTDPYAAIWLYLAGTRLGQKGRQDLEKNDKKLKHQGLTEKIIDLYLGKLSPEDLLASAKDANAKKEKGNLCQANFYLGEHTLLNGAKNEAVKFFREAVDTGAINFVEYTAAKAELRRLSK